MQRNGRIIAAEAYALHRDYIEDEALEIDPWVRRRTLGGKSISAADYIREIARSPPRDGRVRRVDARTRRRCSRRRCRSRRKSLDRVDEATTPLAAFTRAANYLGACALTLPAGLSRGGLPIGVQLMGAPFAEATLVTHRTRVPARDRLAPPATAGRLNRRGAYRGRTPARARRTR